MPDFTLSNTKALKVQFTGGESSPFVPSLAFLRSAELAASRNVDFTQVKGPVRPKGDPVGVGLPTAIGRVEDGVLTGPFDRRQRIVFVPRDAKEIKESGFKDCNELKYVIFHEKSQVEKIQDGAFRQCGKLSAVRLPPSLKTISGKYALGAFELCAALRGIMFPGGIEALGSFTFRNCGLLTFIAFPKGLKEIGWHTFVDCPAIAEVEIPDTVENIDKHSFGSCTSLRKLRLPAPLKKVECGTFSVCKGLTEVIFQEGVVELVMSCFYECVLLTSVELPSTLEIIGYEAFGGCVALVQVNFPAKLKVVRRRAFHRTKVTSADVPAATEVEEMAFPEDCQIVRYDPDSG